MPESNHEVELIDTRDIERFIPVMREIELGDAFFLAMLHWCGIGQRSTPLAYWQVYLIEHANEVVGVGGLYRPSGTDERDYWLGWFGIRPRYRRQGLGSRSLGRIMECARIRGALRFLVYTGATDTSAVLFYEANGFSMLGAAVECAPGLTMDETDIVLMRPL